MFVYMYLIGLVLGLATYLLTFVFVKEANHSKRSLMVLVVGGISLLGSIFVIGGFEGMPFGVLSGGILTTAVLLALFGEKPLWKKCVFTIILLFTLLYTAFDLLNQVDYWVGLKNTFGEDDVDTYTQHLQTDTAIKGYKTFNLLEGNKGVVLSLGGKMAGNNIEVLDVKERGNTTYIEVRTFYNQSSEKNPWILIGLNRLQSEVIILDTDGTVYEQLTAE